MIPQPKDKTIFQKQNAVPLNPKTGGQDVMEWLEEETARALYEARDWLVDYYRKKRDPIYLEPEIVLSMGWAHRIPFFGFYIHAVFVSSIDDPRQWCRNYYKCTSPISMHGALALLEVKDPTDTAPHIHVFRMNMESLSSVQKQEADAAWQPAMDKEYEIPEPMAQAFKLGGNKKIKPFPALLRVKPLDLTQAAF